MTWIADSEDPSPSQRKNHSNDSKKKIKPDELALDSSSEEEDQMVNSVN
jgi:hypothetical protein